ncbi:MAG: 3,4-dehydroadipyl-CoA semialdehyde dehydrogenase [Hydrogenophaga sp.]|uniref:3,4-dehydroadipyl-CoA semialdehyde dehydrogenase n=2 Tax=Hydrogenophaga sp. TaxID=1904254 RepID=UPI0025C12443|nr:3,4-dehydroadipyl-CoA semialdehyde dehydrogenase [Hydrogenophaga sp.]MDO9504746.1 3,4-dehydroadipyl-CoA semialdehyde dehydrogenase [Hydrogenophaga sp.]MDP3205146.1 3,4-dehydroadipyl-CoA semialdehyde dehydrogenase [Hydrogenophaga sp.]MDP3627466.1 3,4-dehydroadipyl-CoA semialdehyde dehydrogenase [Hydrogenophaga sp.]
MTTSTLLPNHLGGQWVTGSGAGTPLFDPVLGTELARVSSAGLDLTAGFAFAREQGGAALRALSYGERAALLGAIVKVLQANRDAYYEIATANCGTTTKDSAVDIDGGIFTLGYYARQGEALGSAHALLDGERIRMGKDPVFQTQHILSPTRGVALFINAFNFPSWGLWEKAAPALLSGVPVIVKPATATAWLTQRMVKDVIDAGILPPGALSVVCGSSAGLMDQLQPFDVVSFTGSAETARIIRSHPAVAERSVRCNIEADSLNSALLDPAATPESEAFGLLVSEVVREMTVKSGQKCTAIRRVFVPRALFDAAAQAIGAKLAKTSVGNPRNEAVRMGALVSQEQKASVIEGIARLRLEAEVLFDGGGAALVDADASSACVAPVLLGSREPAKAKLLHAVEVFGPVATLMAYDSIEEAYELIRRGEGSLVCSVYSADPAFIATASLELGSAHGRVHAISPDVAASHSGHGNVMPMSLHGGPGRAGGGEELGGLRALGFYHRRSAVQASSAALDVLAASAVALKL